MSDRPDQPPLGPTPARRDEEPGAAMPDLGALLGGGAGGPDLGALLAQAEQLQQSLVDAQEELARERIEGSAASGLVTAMVTGTGELVGVTIKPEACDPDDADTLGDMVVAAVRDAVNRQQDMAADRMGPLTGGMPGLGA